MAGQNRSSGWRANGGSRIPAASQPGAREDGAAFEVALARDLVAERLAGGICPWCGGDDPPGLLEVFGHDVVLDACCLAGQEALGVALDPEVPGGAEIFEALAAGLVSGRLVADDGQARLDFGLRIVPTGFARARDFVARHHKHARPPAGWRFGFGIANGPTLIGVVMVGRPVARALDPTQVVEVNRLCLDLGISLALRRNAASALYGAAAREARRRGYSRIVTYTLERESGGSLVAAGWTCEGRTRGGSWSRATRPRLDGGELGPKLRWSRDLGRFGKAEE